MFSYAKRKKPLYGIVTRNRQSLDEKWRNTYKSQQVDAVNIKTHWMILQNGNIDNLILLIGIYYRLTLPTVWSFGCKNWQCNSNKTPQSCHQNNWNGSHFDLNRWIKLIELNLKLIKRKKWSIWFQKNNPDIRDNSLSINHTKWNKVIEKKFLMTITWFDSKRVTDEHT